jgi:hypothetical protein
MSTENETNKDEVKQAEPEFGLAEFLESHPPNQAVQITDLGKRDDSHEGSTVITRFAAPQIQLHCADDSCNGPRFFRVNNESQPVLNNNFKHFYITYRCHNCLNTVKRYALAAMLDDNWKECGICYKFGEYPTFGPPTPARLIKLIGPDREEFLKGRQCENQGLGVGAFIYYRRVVENQKDRILNEIIKVSEKIGASNEHIDILKQAVKETQFTKALENAKDSMPESLLINGHSPLLLLHRALSEGVHSKNDEKCLEIASSVRIVLAELSERLSQALKDEAELSKALDTLINNKND